KAIAANRPEAYFNLGILYQDYMSGSVEDMKQALSFYDQFVSRAAGNGELKPVVEEVERRCQTDEAKKKRKSSKTCRPGRRQNIQLAIGALAALAEMNKPPGTQQPAISSGVCPGSRPASCDRAPLARRARLLFCA